MDAGHRRLRARRAPLRADHASSRKRRAAERTATTLPVAWRHRDERYAEKLATPDTSVADLIGDVDPMKVAEGRSLGDPETIHFGLIPRSHRGIVAINELPDLAERIQVAMLNVMEERDIQIRGYVLRLPLDVLVVASANPEDYTNRGRIITPLKDRFGAEIRTHYPTELDAEIAVIRQEADLVADVPDYLVEILARFTRQLRESSAVDQRSGVSARFAIAGAETIAAAALHRATIQGEDEAVARVVDLETAVDVLGGKIEFESGEEGREDEILTHLLRTATAETVRAHFRGLDFALLVDAHRGRRDGHHRRAGHRPRLPHRPAGAGRVRALRPGLRRASAPPTTASAPAPSSWPSRGSTSPARSARTPTARRRSMAEARSGATQRRATASSIRYDRRRPARPPPRRPRRGARRHRRGRDGRLQPRAGDARVPAPRRPRPGRPRRPGPPGRRAAPRAARSSTTSTARCSEVKELLDKAVLEERKQLARDAMMDDADRAFREMQLEQPAAHHRGRGQRAQRLRLAEPRGARGLREDQGPARAASCSTSASRA